MAFTAVVSAATGAFGAVLVTHSGDATPTPSPAAASPLEYAAATALPSVVKLETTQGDASNEGSGIIVSADGLIVTSRQVVTPMNPGAPPTMRASFADGRTAPFTVIGDDPDSGLAVVAVAHMADLTPLPLASAPAELKTGQPVVAVSAPLGLLGTVSRGVISGLHRPCVISQNSGCQSDDAIQTDAAADPGSTGGALVDDSGHLIGVMMAIGTTDASSGGSIGLNFAIPSYRALSAIAIMTGTSGYLNRATAFAH